MKRKIDRTAVHLREVLFLHYSPDPMKNRGFTICGKPAAAVMRKWSVGMNGEERKVKGEL